jgi:hypothetical protein
MLNECLQNFPADDFRFVKAKEGYCEKPIGRPEENYITPTIGYEKSEGDELGHPKNL